MYNIVSYANQAQFNTSGFSTANNNLDICISFVLYVSQKSSPQNIQCYFTSLGIRGAELLHSHKWVWPFACLLSAVSTTVDDESGH